MLLATTPPRYALPETGSPAASYGRSRTCPAWSLRSGEAGTGRLQNLRLGPKTEPESPCDQSPGPAETCLRSLSWIALAAKQRGTDPAEIHAHLPIEAGGLECLPVEITALTKGADRRRRFFVLPMLGRLSRAEQVEEVARVGWAGVDLELVEGGAEVGCDGEVSESGFFSSFAEGGGGRGFAGLDGAAGDLHALVGALRLSENEKASLPGDVTDDLRDRSDHAAGPWLEARSCLGSERDSYRLRTA